MKTFKLNAAQGEIYVTRIGDVPKKRRVISGSLLALENNDLVIGHSETGHHHVLERPKAKATVTVLDKQINGQPIPEGMKILHALLEEDNALVHLRSTDTHEGIALPAGEYIFRSAREQDHYADLARKSAD
jgi:hypothetical protein